MEIYADIYFLINFSMDFICLYICSAAMKIKANLPKLLIAGAIGGIFSVLSLLLPGNPLLSFFLTLSVGLLMCYIVFSAQGGIFRFFISFIVYCGVSFFMGGAMTFLYSALNRIFPSSNQAPSAAATILFPASLLCAAASLFFSHLSSRFLSTKRAELKISHRDISFSSFALVDSGNLLCDPISGLPVILLCRSASVNFVPSGNFAPEEVSKNSNFFGKVRVIPVKNNFSNGIITAIKPDSVLIDGENKNCLIGFCDIDEFGGFEALLPASLLPLSAASNNRRRKHD